MTTGHALQASALAADAVTVTVEAVRVRRANPELIERQVAAIDVRRVLGDANVGVGLAVAIASATPSSAPATATWGWRRSRRGRCRTWRRIGCCFDCLADVGAEPLVIVAGGVA